MACEFLEFRDGDGERSFARERPFCAVIDDFVQPMRADVCAERYDLAPVEHCEIYRDEAAVVD